VLALGLRVSAQDNRSRAGGDWEVLADPLSQGLSEGTQRASCMLPCSASPASIGHTDDRRAIKSLLHEGTI